MPLVGDIAFAFVYWLLFFCCLWLSFAWLLLLGFTWLVLLAFFFLLAFAYAFLGYPGASNTWLMAPWELRCYWLVVLLFCVFHLLCPCGYSLHHQKLPSVVTPGYSIRSMALHSVNMCSCVSFLLLQNLQ